MTSRNPDPPVRWAAKLARVREVSLLGTADLGFWEDRLLEEDVLPAERAGQAQLLIVAATARFGGIRFRELSFSVLVSRPEEGTRQDAAYLVEAFNSRRLFAFCERAFFWTPYSHGTVRLSASFPASIQLATKGDGVFRAAMRAVGSASGREPSWRGEDGWEGRVFLPETCHGKGRRGRFFLARIRGHTLRYSFLPSEDSVAIRPSRDSPILPALVDSHFVASGWIVREDSTHAKSTTYRAGEAWARRPSHA